VVELGRYFKLIANMEWMRECGEHDNAALEIIVFITPRHQAHFLSKVLVGSFRQEETGYWGM
jgi:hypothetical protein